MSNINKRDEGIYHRLSSFLSVAGNLDITYIKRIKEHVFLLEAISGNKYILKGHHKLNNIQQQWRFFNQMKTSIIVPFVLFPNGKWYLKSESIYWTISPYKKGRKLNYTNPNDRHYALRTIQKFHKNANNIFVKQPLKRRLFYERWLDRLERFKDTELLFLTNGYGSLFNDITKHTEKYIQFIAKFPWKENQNKAIQEGKWVHGDVASHNFIFGHKLWLIDFDLLQNTDQMYDYIQLGQRFLPHVQWNVDQLMAYKMVPEHDTEIWLYSLFIPSDLLRDWLYYLQKPSHRPLKEFFVEMENQWIQRKGFLKDIQLMVK